MPTEPADPDPNDQLAFEKWKIAIKVYTEKSMAYSDFLAGLFNVVLGQCTDGLQNRLKSHPDYPAAQQDGIALLTIIKLITYTFEERRDLWDAVSDVKEGFYSLRQGKYQSLQQYYEVFLNQVGVLEEVGIDLDDTCLVNQVAAAAGRPGAPEDADHEAAKQKALAIRFIRGTNEQHKKYLTELRHSFLNGQDNYPATLSKAYNILQHHEP